MLRSAPHPDEHGSHRNVPEGPPAPKRVPFDGPRGLRALRAINQIRLDPLPILTPLQQKWGDRVGLSVGPYKYVLLYHPDDIEALLVGGTHKTMKAYALRQGRWMMGGQLLVAEGEMHTRQRKALAPAFGTDTDGLLGSPMVLLGTVDEIVDRLLDRRDRWGYSYVVVPQAAAQTFAPVVARLDGR